jgi:hypothetical protein
MDPKLSPTTVIDSPAVRGTLPTPTNDETGASNENAEKPVPATAASVTFAETSTTLSRLDRYRQLALVDDVHEAELHDGFDKLDDTVPSTFPKSNPEMLTHAPPD